MPNLRRRIIAAVAAGATGIGLTGLPAAAAPPPPPDTTDFCQNVPDGFGGFTDIAVTANDENIECLAYAGITTGNTATTYNPSGQVSRAQMATFIARTLDTISGLDTGAFTLSDLPAAAPDAFNDDNGLQPHETNINRLAGAGIVNGTGNGQFSPANPVTRGQMATFINNGQGFVSNGNEFASTEDFFTDDNGLQPHEPNINGIASVGIAQGVNGTLYVPAGPVSRNQMASFIIRWLTVLYDAGAITELPAPSTGAITITPAGDRSNPTDAAAGGEETFTATGITSTQVDLRLFPCENVTSTGAVTFADANPDDNVADPGAAADVEADIVAVNGTAQPANTEFVDDVTVVNGAVTFSVDSDTPDCVVAVVWADADNDDAVDVGADNVPTEPFGATGRITFTSPPAATSTMDENVLAVDKANNAFQGCEITSPLPDVAETVSATDCFTFAYDSTDLFFIDANGDSAGQSAEQATLDQFEAALSTNDDVAGDYNATPALQSTFVLGDEAPAAPTGLSAASVDQDTVRLTWTPVPGADSYRAYQLASTALLCPAFSTTGATPYTSAGTVPGNSTTVDVNGLTNGTRYCFAVTAVDDGDESAASNLDNATPAPPPPDTTAPAIVDVELVTDQNTQNILDAGDIIEVCFDEPIANPTDADIESFGVADQDTTFGRISNDPAANTATFALGAAASTNVAAAAATSCPANQLLIVTLTAAPSAGTPPFPGLQPGVAAGATITQSGGVQDTSGNAYAPTINPADDESIDKEAGPEPD